MILVIIPIKSIDASRGIEINSIYMDTVQYSALILLPVMFSLTEFAKNDMYRVILCSVKNPKSIYIIFMLFAQKVFF